MDRFTVHLVAFHAVREMVPVYAVYALLFASTGLDAAQISSLFVIWSVTGFVLEVPSGAWADTVDRRLLLVLSGLTYAAGFATWQLWPSYPGFALGFVLWGLSGSLMSGTFEALLHDELAERAQEPRFAWVLGWARSAGMVLMLGGTASAALLVELGGFALTVWVSVGVALAHTALAATLPVSERARRAPRPHESLGEATRAGAVYLAMLRSGVGEARRSPRVRHVLLVAAGVLGLTTVDEYFPLMAREQGASIPAVPLLLALTVAAQAVGTALAGPASTRSSRFTAACVAGGAVLLGAGAANLAPVWWSFAAIAVGYGLLNNAMLVGETRVQEVISGPARATVTSVFGLATEVVALSSYVWLGLAAAGLGVSHAVAVLMAPVLLGAWAVLRWFPPGEAPASAGPGAGDPLGQGRQ